MLEGLNPCFSGRYAGSFITHFSITFTTSLNPCFSGRYAGRGLVTVGRVTGEKS